MECAVCSFKKSPSDFPGSVMSALAAPRTLHDLPHRQLLFACMDCLATKTELLGDALEAGTISVETHESLFDEVSDWKQWKCQQTLSSAPATELNPNDGYINVSLLARHFRIEINAATTVKEVKVQLGKLVDRHAPSIRLLFHGKDVKVKNNQSLALLSAYKIRSGDVLEALLPISKYAGQSVISGLGVGRDGNAVGAEADLGQAGGFVGMKIVFLDLYGQTSPNVKTVLEAMGFEVRGLLKTIPSSADLRTLLATANQFWVISDPSSVFNAESLEIISDFNKNGGALYLWGDNEPYYAAANSVLRKILPGVQLHGNYRGDQQVQPMKNGSGPGFIAHPIFTGIVNLYEGDTIARFVGNNARLQYVMNSSEGQPCLGICEDTNNNGSGRIAVDVGFTRLYCKWDASGTARFVSNIAAWLCSPDCDWM